MLHIVESKKPLADVARDLEHAVTRHKFGLLGVHDLKAKMAEQGVPFARECRVKGLWFSSPSLANARRSLLLPRCYHFTPREGKPTVSAAMADRRILACLDRPGAAQFANRPGGNQ